MNLSMKQKLIYETNLSMKLTDIENRHMVVKGWGSR